ncbi:hypothetical protein GW931_01320 [archaeon]|nr:hypothetical protein [archaeon]PJC45236.1 MAG: hypothetical protein CO037_02570 [Candidatus Pacearchaeota archaeon CG_4_9_14_0_2_um_filter_30_8]
MGSGVYKKDGKKWVLILLNLILGFYFLNSKLSFFGNFNFGAPVDSIFVLFGGILFILNLFYLIFFSRRI